MPTVTELWTQWQAFLTANLPETAARLRPPAPAQALAELEAQRGIELPTDVRELYGLHDGELDEEDSLVDGAFFGLYFLPLDRMSVTGGTEEMPDSTSYPPGAVRAYDTHRRWFPLGHDGGGNFIGFDLDPAENGTVGQIINFGRDETDKFVMAPSLREFLALVLGEIGRGNYRLDPDENGRPRFVLGSYYLTDTLRGLLVKA